MSNPFTIATPQYHVKGIGGELLNVFGKRSNAISAAIDLAVEYPGDNFVVIRRANRKNKIIFSVSIDIKSAFSDIPDVYGKLFSVYQKKLNKTKLWRKTDGPNSN